jgi:hypothetical protein
MNLYFDTNIYNFIAETGESVMFRKFLKKGRYRVLASSENLLEIIANPNSEAQYNAIKTLTTVASYYEKVPMSWRQAQEVLFEIRRCRPQWLRNIPFDKKARQLLQSSAKRWEDAKEGILPNATAYGVYRRDYESGVSGEQQFQKALRAFLLKRNNDYFLGSRKIDLENPDTYWRVDCLSVWHNAIVVKARESRDYADWLEPFTTKNTFSDTTTDKFWLEEVRAENLPCNRLSSLVSFYQVRHKITHGNPTDQMHAPHLLDVDILLTADRAFFDVLSEIVKLHFPNNGRPVFVNRSSTSALGELVSVLEE